MNRKDFLKLLIATPLIPFAGKLKYEHANDCAVQEDCEHHAYWLSGSYSYGGWIKVTPDGSEWIVVCK